MTGTDEGMPVLVVETSDVLDVWNIIDVAMVCEVSVLVPMG